MSVSYAWLKSLLVVCNHHGRAETCHSAQRVSVPMSETSELLASSCRALWVIYCYGFRIESVGLMHPWFPSHEGRVSLSQPNPTIRSGTAIGRCDEQLPIAFACRGRAGTLQCCLEPQKRVPTRAAAWSSYLIPPSTAAPPELRFGFNYSEPCSRRSSHQLLLLC